MEGKKGKQQKTNEHQESLQQAANNKKLQPAASAFQLPSYKTKKYSTPTFQSPTSSMPKIPHEQVIKYKYPETHKPFTLPSIQQSHQRSQQNTLRLSESSITSIESTSNKEIVPTLPNNLCGVNLPSVCNKPMKRPISKSNSSESSSDRSVTDTNNRSTGMASFPVEVTVSSRVEVKTRFPDSLPTSSIKNGSTTSTCSLPSIESRQPPRKKLEEVSGFVVVTKQNYFKPIGKKQQNRKPQQRSSEQEIYCVEDQKDTDYYNQQMKGDNQQEIRFGGSSRIYLDSQDVNGDQETEMSEYKSEKDLLESPFMGPQMCGGDIDKCTGTIEDRIQLQDICDEKENETILIRANEIYNSDFGRQFVECQRSEIPPNISQAVQTLPHRNSVGDKRRDERNHKQDMKMQTIAEGCAEEFISSMKQSPVSSARDKIYANDYITQPYVCALDSTSDMKKLEKIEAIEGWMKIYESEFFNERYKEIDNKKNNTSVKEAMEHNTAVPMQEPHNLNSHATILPGTRDRTVEPAGIQTSTNFFHSYVDVIGAKQRESLIQRIPECSGSRPRNEGAKKSPSIKLSQQGLDPLKYFTGETLDEIQFNQGNYGSRGKKELPFPKTLTRIHHTEDQPLPPKGIQENSRGLIQNMNTKSNFSENSSLMTLNNSERINFSSQANNINLEDVSIEPICEAVRVVPQQQSNSFQFKARSGFKKHSTEVGNNATLEQIEAMIEPEIEEHPSREQTFKKRKPRKKGAKPEQNNTNCHSLMPDIVKVKLGIDNQSKILDRLDLMMKHNEITNRATHKTNDTQAALVPCSEILVSLHKSDTGIGKSEIISRRPFSFPSSLFHSKNVTDSESSGISEMNKSHTQCNVNRECSNMSAIEGMNDGRIIEQRLHVSPQCPSLQKFPVGQTGGSGYQISSGHPIESGASLRHNMHLETTTVPPSPGIFSTSSPPACHSMPLTMNSTAYSLTQRSTVPCFVNHDLPTYHSPAHSQDISNIPLSTSDIIMVTSTESLPHYSADFNDHSQHNYSISLIPMSPKSETNSPYPQENAEWLRLQHIQEFKQEIKVEDSENCTIIDFPLCNVGRQEYGEGMNMMRGANENVPPSPANNAGGRQSCLDDITSLPGGTGCVYGSNGPLTVSPQVSNNQSQMLPPIGSISKHFQAQNEADTNVRNLSSSSVSTRRSSAKSANVRGGKRALSASPLGDGVVDLTSLIRCSPTSLLGFSSSSCSQENGRQASHGCYGHLSARDSCSPLPFNNNNHQQVQEEGAVTCALAMRSLEQTCCPPYHDLSSNQIVLPQHESEMLASIMGKAPASYTQDAMVTLCALRDDVTISTSPTSISTTSTSQQLVTQSSDPFLGLLGNEDATQQQTSPEQTEDDEPTGGSVRECRWIDCYAVFPDQESLVHHIEKSHVELRKGEDFSCFWQGCPRRSRPFNARYKLLIHMRVHSGEKPNKCPFEGCIKAFSRLENLKIHQRSHTGERPYSCQYSGCTKAFSNSSDRAKHQRTHVDTKPYACQVEGCSKRYTDPSSLRKHVKNHTTKEQVQVRKKIRSEDKSVHMMPETPQGAEHGRKHSVSSASRDAADSSTLDQSSVKRYPPSSSYCDSQSNHGTGYSSPSMPQGPLPEDLDYRLGFTTNEPEFLDHVLREADGFPSTSSLEEDVLEYIPFDSVRRLLGEHIEYIDSALQEQLELESDIEQQFLELSNLERCSPSQFSSFQHDQS